MLCGTLTWMRRLNVGDTHFLETRGVVACGVVPSREHGFTIGTSVEIIRPDGSHIVSSVRGVENFTSCFSERISIGLLLDEAITKEDVPPGSVITADSA